MINFLKRLKWSYQFYNFFQRNALKHNEALFKKYGVKKRYYSSISSKDFEHLEKQYYTADLKKLKEDQLLQKFNSKTQNSILNFNNNGYAVIKEYFDPAIIDSINEEIDTLLKKEVLKFEYNHRKIMFAIHHSKLIKTFAYDKDLSKLYDYLIGGKADLFQSINFVHSGSEQHTHSDSLHMTTYPLGGLLGVWIALEDITEENGPVHYYPGSHKLPYFLNKDFDNEGTSWSLGTKAYSDYEKMISTKVTEAKIEKQLFTAKKGDILIWHANLLHGGEAHLNKSLTRKSMVLHFFEADAICYHEVTQRPALRR